ncbi:uncharacterized protein BP01DRAFT_396819 [Aspergillus saccharolyticus JOP 1030-1]|uniref:Cora family metal ion transporter n=1 Tax=Aspergillus saccharolyticus JOP 1030-1 TaxID=1450539 RepID=A0A318ZI07_9EURO|nr:hypothetical protein BP01DRAFT_396819 [Aspergillus saccharolyticus JOP 1030-1]PYH46397.1 hypothetical protein BP01DRAFT_396819 [Aspergillus saccharolyticus JOP 1030-1]
MPAVKSEYDEPGDDGVRFLRSRVRSLNSDPLHSVAYMHNLASYLNRPYQKPSRPYCPARGFGSSTLDNVFLYLYSLAQPERAEAREFSASAELEMTEVDEQSELIFLTGYPSPQWLNTLVTRYEIDHRFLHRHLDFLPTGRRDWYLAPSIPSRSQQFIQLAVPCIVFTGNEGRFVRATDLQEARFACAELLRQRSKSFFAGADTPAGLTIVREVNIHSGEAMVVEHAITICVLTGGEAVKVIVWSDAANDSVSSYVPIPDGGAFQNLACALECCPVFFEKHLNTTRGSKRTTSGCPGSVQALSVLARDYGHTLDWSTLQQDPVLVLDELFTFQSAAAMQYLNMLRKDITQAMHRTQTRNVEFLNMEDISNFEYTKNVLVRWASHFRSLSQALDPESPGNPIAPLPHQIARGTMLTLKRRDLEFLVTEAQLLIELCDSGKVTIMSNFSIAESKRTAEESRLVGELTKLTNRLTFIFLPISFVTSVFGMNFKQFGQGPLDIWIWVAVTVPLLVVCVILVEWRISVRALVEKGLARMRHAGS